MDRSLTARFETRQDAELAIEHLVQNQGIERDRISVLPLGSENTAGTEVAGSDAPAGQPGSRERDDAALHGAVELSVHLPGDKAEAVRQALTEAGARDLAEA